MRKMSMALNMVSFLCAQIIYFLVNKDAPNVMMIEEVASNAKL
jgi:hypothetical protein